MGRALAKPIFWLHLMGFTLFYPSYDLKLFTVPVDKNSKKLIELKLVDEKGKKSYTGKVSGTDKLKVAVFELPAFSHVQLNY